MQRRGSALFLFITAACLLLMFPQSIFADRSCSLTVHSYISQSGDESDGTYADGQSIPDDASPLSGAVYSIWKVGDVTSQTISDTVTLCACHMDEQFIELLIPGGLSPDSRSNGSESDYQLSEIQDAWDKAPKDETVLTELVKSHGSALPPSDIDGVTRSDNLSQGLYVLAITQFPGRDDLRVLSGHAPILLMLPQLNTQAMSTEGEPLDPDNLWIYDVSVYPKSRTLESGKKILLPDMTLKDADDRETGSTLSFISYINLPNLGDSSNYDEIALDDIMTDGLHHKEIRRVVCGDWLGEENLSYNLIDAFKELSPTSDYSASGTEHGFTLSLTDKGLSKINSLTGNSGLYVIYDALLGANAAVGTEGPEANESIWNVSTDRTTASHTLRSPLAYAATYGINLKKTGLPNASEARFCVRFGDRLLYFEKTGAGIYTAQGTTAHEDSLSALSPAPDGLLRIRGLDSGSYTIAETKTGAGHSLLTSPLTVTLTGEAGSGSLVKAELGLGSANPISLSVSADNGGIAELSVSNEAMITPLKAGDNSYWKVAACILVFSIMLLGALMIRKRRLESGEDPLADRLLMTTDRVSAEDYQNEKKRDQNRAKTD